MVQGVEPPAEAASGILSAIVLRPHRVECTVQQQGQLPRKRGVGRRGRIAVPTLPKRAKKGLRPTPLYVAASHGLLRQATMLLGAGADVDAGDRLHTSPLYITVQEKCHGYRGPTRALETLKQGPKSPLQRAW